MTYVGIPPFFLFLSLVYCFPLFIPLHSPIFPIYYEIRVGDKATVIKSLVLLLLQKGKKERKKKYSFKLSERYIYILQQTFKRSPY